MRYAIMAIVVVVSLAAATLNRAQAQRPNQLDVRQLMSVNEFKAAGLEKLSTTEIQALNTWLDKFARRILQPPQGGRGDCATAIESQIEGEFEGWSGENIFKLANGQIWQQSSYAYTYYYAYRPEVLIYASGGGCRMKVNGVEDSIAVKRLK